jgi:hypothetical protein
MDEGRGTAVTNDSNKERVINADEGIAKQLHYKSLTDFISINEQSFSVLGYDKGNLDEDALLITHFYKETKASNPEYTLTRNYDAVQFRSKFKSVIRRMDRSLKKSEKPTKFSVRFLCSHEIGNEMVLVAEFNIAKHIQKPRRFSRTDRARHKKEIQKQSIQYIGIVYNATTSTFRVTFDNSSMKSWLLRDLNAEARRDEKDTSWQLAFDNLISNAELERKQREIEDKDALIAIGVVMAVLILIAYALSEKK